MTISFQEIFLWLHKIQKLNKKNYIDFEKGECESH